MASDSDSLANLLVEVFPVVLGHESEQGEEGPAEGVEARVAVVWIAARFDTFKALWTEPYKDTVVLRTCNVPPHKNNQN